MSCAARSDPRAARTESSDPTAAEVSMSSNAGRYTFTTTAR